MRKIAFHLNCLEQGGAERVVTNLAHQFMKEGYEVLIATEWEGENEFQIDQRIRRVHVGLKEADKKKGRISKVFLRIKYLRDFMLKERPDMLIAFAKKANYRALMASLFTKQKVIIAVRTDPVGHYDSFFDILKTALLFGRANGAVFQTLGQRDFFPKRTRERSRIILNPINDKYIQAKIPQTKRKEVVQSGRLVDFKNQPMLVRAFIGVHEKHPDYVLKIYGGDSFDGTKEVLEKCIADHGAQDYVFLMGASDSLEKQIAEAEVFAFSSDWEGLPNTLLEAMALEMPIVATDCPCGGPGTVLKNEVNGLLIPIKDEEALKEGINRLIEDKELAAELGKKAGEIREIANGKAIFMQWRDYIEELIEGGR